MIKEQQTKKKSAVRKHSRCPTICFFILTGLNALLSFLPSSDGSFKERLQSFLLTEMGPFSWIIFDDEFIALIIGIIILGLFISSTFIFRSRILGFVTCIAVILWFLLSMGIMLRCFV